MASLRELIVDAIGTLCPGDGGAIPALQKSRTFAVDVSGGPAMSHYWVRDEPRPVTSRYGPLRAWRLTVRIDVWGAGTDTVKPENVIDPLIAYLVSRLDGKEGTPGTDPYMQITVGEAEPDLEQYDHGYCRVSQYFYVDYQTKAGNLEAAA